MDITKLFRKEGGTMKLHPIQSQILCEAYANNGLIRQMPVGYGKNLISLLMSQALDSDRTLVLVPAAMKSYMDEEIKVYDKHFNLNMDKITILSYSSLSLPKGRRLLRELAPDLIVARGVQCLKSRFSARTVRVIEYLATNPSCRFVGLSSVNLDLDEFYQLGKRASFNKW